MGKKERWLLDMLNDMEAFSAENGLTQTSQRIAEAAAVLQLESDDTNVLLEQPRGSVRKVRH